MRPHREQKRQAVFSASLLMEEEQQLLLPPIGEKVAFIARFLAHQNGPIGFFSLRWF
jgi:hypothetical protein